MYTKTITPESTSVTIELPESFVGKHVRVTVYVEKEEKPRKAPAGLTGLPETATGREAQRSTTRLY